MCVVCGPLIAPCATYSIWRWINYFFSFLFFVAGWWDWGTEPWLVTTAFVAAAEIISPLPTAPRACRSAGWIYTQWCIKKILQQELWVIHISARRIKILGVKDRLVTGTQFAFENWVPHSCPVPHQHLKFGNQTRNWCLPERWDEAWLGRCGVWGQRVGLKEQDWIRPV